MFFVSIPEAVRNYLEKNQIDIFYLLGIPHVTDFKNLSAFAELDKEYSITVPNAELGIQVEKTVYLAKDDIGKAVRPLRDLMGRINDSLVVVASTEISTILDQHKKPFKNYNIVDSLQLLAEHVTEKYVEGIFDTLFIDKSTSYAVVGETRFASKEDFRNALLALLEEIDHEFIPPLSCRDSTTTNDFSVQFNSCANLDAYLAGLFVQNLIVCKRKDDDHIIGFMSYKTDHMLDFEKDKKCYYITTLGVTKSERGKGIAVQLYKKIEEIAISHSVFRLATRTWSTNDTHIKILLDSGYRLARRFKHDRGPGIDSVYYIKDLQEYVV